MVRIGISVEGTTEEIFVKKVLQPYLAIKGLYLTPISMGGDVKLDRVKSELKNIAYSFDHVTTFYDFYGFKGKDPAETKSSLEQRIYMHTHESVRNKLTPYIQMYEFEGLLFSCPSSMAIGLNELNVEIWAKEILDSFDNNPERVNNSQETAPSKRLACATSYRKTTHGPNIANEMGVEKMREMCAGFNEWLIKLEALKI
jgi:hypothetical protein